MIKKAQDLVVNDCFVVRTKQYHFYCKVSDIPFFWNPSPNEERDLVIPVIEEGYEKDGGFVIRNRNELVCVYGKAINEKQQKGE